jgi:hypothetical protein
MKGMQPKLNSLLIVGCQRSGTTLVGHIIGSVNRCFLIDEFDGLYPWYNSCLSDENDTGSLLTDALKLASDKYTDARHLFKVPDELVGYTIVAKAPNLTYSYSQLKEHLPKPKIIFMVRDARAVVASMLALSEVDFVGNQLKLLSSKKVVTRKYQKDYLFLLDESKPKHQRMAMLWKIKTQLHKEFVDSHLNPYVLKYEELIKEAPKYLSEMGQLFDLEINSDALNYHKKLIGIGPGNTSREQALNTRSLNKWQSQLTSIQQMEVLEIAEETMHDLGYSL